MKAYKILVVVLAGLVVFMFVSERFFDEDSNYTVPSEYIEKIKESEKKIQILESESKSNRRTIQNIRYEIDLMDSIIYNATPDQLDSLFTGFFNSVR